MYRIATTLAIACLAAAPLLAQGDGPPVDRQVAELVRQDRALRQRIGQLQLDALVARVAQTMGEPLPSQKAPLANIERDIQHELALHSD